MKKKNVLILGTLLVLLLMSLSGCGKTEQESANVAVGQAELIEKNEIEEKTTSLKFPYILEEQLEVLSLSTATMPNPDAGGEIGENIASIELINSTGKFIELAEILVSLEDGTQFEFIVHDLPNAGKVQAFEVKNTVYEDKILCEKVEIIKLQTFEGDHLMSQAITIEEQETLVTLTNTSQSDLQDLTVICMCDFDGSYFGGTSYAYPVESLLAGESVTIDATDCYLGVADVVRIKAN